MTYFLQSMLSKHVALYPLKRATTQVIINKIKRYVEEIEKPKRVLFDNGTQFRSKKWLKEMSLLDMQVSYTSVYFPQGNMTERINREIGRLLRSLCHQQHTKWAYVIPKVQELLNQVVHESTGFTPNEIHVHQSRKFPISFVKFPSDPSLPFRDLVIMMSKRRFLSKAQRTQGRHDRGGKIEDYKTGDWVYVTVDRQSSAGEQEIKKLFLLYEGPYIVREKGF